jgi:L-aminopeptidase/D-esterase-like protein
MVKKNQYKTNDDIDLVPKISKSSKPIKINFDNIKFSCCEYSEGPVGLTYIDFGKVGAKTHMDIRGGNPAIINCLTDFHHHFLNGICIVGGSIMGLEAATSILTSKVIDEKLKPWKGINAVTIYSHNLKKNRIVPDKQLGKFAYNNMTNILYNGQIGAGVSARHGQGVAYKKYKNGMHILAIVINNAHGDIYKNNKLIYENPKRKNCDIGTNTTITTVITNLIMDDSELKQMTHQVNSTIGEVIKPFNTLLDGDVFYACSTCKMKKPRNYDSHSMIGIYSEMGELVKEAIYNSMK